MNKSNYTTASSLPPISISVLNKIDSRRATLCQSTITGFHELPTFGALRDAIFGLRFPHQQSNKFECYGWVPTLYEYSTATFRPKGKARREVYGWWRTGKAEASHLTTFYADIDNKEPGHPHLPMAEAARRLDALGVSYFVYPTYSSTPAHEKYRVVIDISRHVTRLEMGWLFVWLNWHVFGYQGDPSIYDPGDYVYAPPSGAAFVDRLDGAPLDVDRVLEEEQELRKTHPEAYVCIFSRKADRADRPRKSRSKEQTAQKAARRADRTCRPLVTIRNPDYWNSAWDGLYAARIVNRSHWETMRSLLGKVWAKSGGALTFGEMVKLFEEIDATDGGGWTRRHCEDKRDALIDYLMDQHVETREEFFAEALAEPRKSKRAAGAPFPIKVLDWACSEGKTTAMRNLILKTGGRWLFAVDRISLIEERRAEFAQHAKFAAFEVYEAHSRMRFGDDEDEMKVVGQLKTLRSAIDAEPAQKHMIVFVTHQALSLMDWSAWSDFNVIIDEVLDVWRSYTLRCERNHDVIKQYIEVAEDDGDAYIVSLTEAGRRIVDSPADDDIENVFFSLLELMRRRGQETSSNRYVWVDKDGWDSPNLFPMKFWSLVTPELLAPFGEVWMLGDELTRSITYEMWRTQFNVDWQIQADGHSRRSRSIPSGDLAIIKYFSEDAASFKRFRQSDDPLRHVAEWLRANEKRDYIWTTNSGRHANFLVKINKAGGLPGTYLTPKQHGTNDWQSYKCVVWLAAMQPPQEESERVKLVCGFSRAELLRWREFNSMYQFVMRTALRDFVNREPVTIYVFNRDQAGYLQSRLGGTIERVDVGIVDRVATVKNGRKPKYETEEERAEARREIERKSKRKNRQSAKLLKYNNSCPPKPLLCPNPLVSVDIPPDTVSAAPAITRKEEGVPVDTRFIPTAEQPLAPGWRIVDLPPYAGSHHRMINDALRCLHAKLYGVPASTGGSCGSAAADVSYSAIAGTPPVPTVRRGCGRLAFDAMARVRRLQASEEKSLFGDERLLVTGAREQ